MKTSFFLLAVVLIGCHSREKNQETQVRSTVPSSPDIEIAAAPVPPPVDTLQAFVDQFPERIAQQIAFIQKYYAQTIARKGQLDCYELFQQKGTNDFILVPKDSAKHVYGEEPYDMPVYYYQGNSLEGGTPIVLFYKDKNTIALIEEHNYDTAEGSYAETKEFYFSENHQLIFMFHHYEHIDYWTKHDEGSEQQARQHRYYFLDERPIRCLKKEYTGFDHASEMITHQPNETIPLKKGHSILREAQELLNSVNKKH